MATRKRAALEQSPPISPAALRKCQQQIFAATQALEGGIPLSDEMRAFILRSLGTLGMLLLNESKRAQASAPGRRRAHATWEAARVVKVLVDEDEVTVSHAVWCVCPEGTAKDLGRIKKAYEKLNKGEYTGLRFPDGLHLMFVDKARAHLLRELEKRNK